MTVRPEAFSRLPPISPVQSSPPRQRRDPAGIDVEADGAGKMLGKRHRDRQADIAQPQNRNFTHRPPGTVKIHGEFTASALTKALRSLVNGDCKGLIQGLFWAVVAMLASLRGWLYRVCPQKMQTGETPC